MKTGPVSPIICVPNDIETYAICWDPGCPRITKDAQNFSWILDRLQEGSKSKSVQDFVDTTDKSVCNTLDANHESKKNWLKEEKNPFSLSLQQQLMLFESWYYDQK